MNGTQRKYLRERLNLAVAAKMRDKDEKEPVKVRAARKLIEAYQNAEYQKRKTLRTKVEAVSDPIKTMILFGDAKAALAAVEAFEKQVFG